jgi:hypothetical protein
MRSGGAGRSTLGRTAACVQAGGRRARRWLVAGIPPVNGDRGSASSGAGRGAGQARTAVRGRCACAPCGRQPSTRRMVARGIRLASCRAFVGWIDGAAAGRFPRYDPLPEYLAGPPAARPRHHAPGGSLHRAAGLSRVHLLRDVLAHVPKGAQGLVAAYARTIFAQPDGEAARRGLAEGKEAAALYRANGWRKTWRHPDPQPEASTRLDPSWTLRPGGGRRPAAADRRCAPATWVGRSMARSSDRVGTVTLPSG